ncbi:MAG: alpha/beta hydrolase [Desulfobacteraceae bacterium]|nr:alpha/beta hydrolase [Desulfobacteraceae bacterium]
MRFSETRLDTFIASDTLKLDIHIWEPDSPKALFLAVHGGLAHGGDYVTPALFFKDKGIATAAYDLRGHKQEKVHLDSFDQFVDDTFCFLKWAKDNYPDIPIFYLGHSIGSLIGTHVGLNQDRLKNRLKGFVFSSPYYKNAIKTPPFVIPMVKILSKVLPNLTIPNSIDANKLTHDQEITRRHKQDEADGLRASKASMRFGNEIFCAQDWVKGHIENWEYPLFVVLSGNDQVADTPESEELLQQLNGDLLTCVVKENNYHENYNETDRDNTFEQIYKWVEPLI